MRTRRTTDFIVGVAGFALIVVTGVVFVRRTTAAEGQEAPRSSVAASFGLGAFLIGRWNCRGGTPAGQPMESNVEFQWALDSVWLEETHVDLAPGRYKSLAMWSRDLSSPSPTAIVFDSFGGNRRFVGELRGDSIVWVRDTTDKGARPETFTYKRLTPDAYWYGWQVQRASGAPETLGDSLTCRRTKANR